MVGCFVILRVVDIFCFSGMFFGVLVMEIIKMKKLLSEEDWEMIPDDGGGGREESN